MSSPATVEYELLRALATAAIEAVAEENRRRAKEEERAHRLAELQRSLAAYRREKARHSALARDLAALRSRFPDHNIPIEIPALPADPALDDAERLDVFSRRAEAMVLAAEKELRQAARRLDVDRAFSAAVILAADDAGSPPTTVADLLAAHVRRSAWNDEAPRQAASRVGREQRSAVLIERVAQFSAAELPSEINALLNEFLATPSQTRAQMLETEVKIRIGQLLEDKSRRDRETEEARQLIDRLPPSDDFGVSKLVGQLSLVVWGEIPLTDALRAQVENVVAQQAAELRQQETVARQAAASAILAAALNDLGYEAEPIEKTLFAEGGMVHFHEAAWGDYYMRMRVSPERQQINFNMVRAAANGDHTDHHRQDASIENAWCSESGFKKLIGVLKDRGLDFTMVREIKAGSLPVQVVSPDDVPLQKRRSASSGAERRRRQAPPVSKSIKRQ